jgi:imidazolonepropionase-like amidohydrolase
MGRAFPIATRALFAALLVAAPVSAQPSSTIAFVDVNVVPMDAERVVPNQTVVVRAGEIVAVGPVGSTAVPAGATRVDGRGQYLLPGLAEMHGHIPGPNNPQFQEDVLFLYVAQGALTVRGMQGHPSHLALRERVRQGDLVGPLLFLSSPPISGNNASSAAVADSLVRTHKAAGYDLLKVHENIRPEAYESLARTAHSLDMQFGGHVSDLVGLEGALAAKQTTVDHLDNYTVAIDGDASKIAGIARATREAGVANVPTMALWEVILGAHDPAGMQGRPENRYMPRQMVNDWVERVSGIRNAADQAEAAREISLRNRILKALHDEGAVILMGTDAPQLFSVPGFSLHRELAVMAEAGLTPYQILRTGTVNVAEHLGIADEAGTVAVGKRADLVLLEANPLENIANAQRIAGVVSNGRWLPQSEIQQRLGAIAARWAADGND